MTSTLDTLTLDLLEWLRARPRDYAEVMDAWRTSCPRFPVWEDANTRGFVTRVRDPAGGAVVSLTEAGDEYLRRHRGPPGAVDGRSPPLASFSTG
jgi:D-3-phosphoglycerate dehydrogenase